MGFYFDSKNLCFYHSDIHGKSMPKNAVKITDEKHAEMMRGQTEGKLIAADKDGNPVLNDAPTIDQKVQLCTMVKAQRNKLLSLCDWTVLPDCALTTAQKTAWKAYRQALRDVPEQSDFPNTVTWPTAPAGGK